MSDAPPRLEDALGLELRARSTNRGLARRLVDNTLRPPERQDLERVEAIARLEEEGKMFPEIAETLSVPLENLRRFVATDKYRLLRRYVGERLLLVDDQGALQRRHQERRRFDTNAAKALDYFDQAFRRHPKNDLPKGIRAGDFKDLDRAERAAKMIAASQGWLEPIPTNLKPRDLTPGVIQKQMQAMRAADQREMVVRVTTQAGETVEIGVRDGGAA